MSRDARRFGIRDTFLPTVVAVLFLTLLPLGDSAAQQSPSKNVLQLPRVAASTPLRAAPALKQHDDRRHLLIPVSVVDNSGECVRSLGARDLALEIGGEDSQIDALRPVAGGAVAAGILIDISESMQPRVPTWGKPPKLRQERSAARHMLAALSDNDRVFLATFARRFHLMEAFTADHGMLEERIPMIAVADTVDDLDATGLYESMLKGVTVLTHAPAPCDRRALIVITDGQDAGSRHGVDDVIAKAQFAGVAIYNILVTSAADFSAAHPQEFDMATIRGGIGRAAHETGGETFVVNWHGDDDLLAAAAHRIASELDASYLVEFSVSPWSAPVLPVELMIVNQPWLHPHAPAVVRFQPRDEMRPAQAITAVAGPLPE
jgi:VWFA-related protein